MGANVPQQIGVLHKQLLNHLQSSQAQHGAELNAIVQRLDEIDRRLERLESKAANAPDQ